MTPNSDSLVCSSNRRDVPLVVAALVWAICYLAALFFLKQPGLAPAVKMALAVLPVIPFAVFLLRMIAHLRNFDELHRRVHLEALAFAFPVTVLILMVLELLERAYPLQFRGWSSRQLWAFLPLFYFLGLVVAWRRYR